jgi:hypothetical protein
MRSRFARELVRAGRLDAPPPGARERAFAWLGLERASPAISRLASGAAVVALLALILGWGPRASAAAPPADQATQCTSGIEAPPCADAAARAAAGARAAAVPTGSSAGGGSFGRSSG